MTSKNSSHLKAFQTYLKENKIEAVVVEETHDLFYLTGLHLSAGCLIVTPRASRLFVDGRYILLAKEKALMPALLLEEKNIQAFLKNQKVKRLGFDSLYTSYARSLALKKLSPLKALPHPLREVRLIKDKAEIRALKKSGVLLWKGFEEIRRSLKVGVTEKELAKRFEIFCLEHGAEKLGFDPIIAFGENSANPHYHVSDQKLKKGDTVLIDIGVVVDNYHSDMTRTLFFGVPKPKMKRLYEIVYAAQKEALAKCKPGVHIEKLDAAARKVMVTAGLLKYYPHGLGHGVGLQVHEHPRLSIKSPDKKMKLKAGMVFTVEPGLYIPGLGGVRYEDTVIVTAKGHENLYPDIPLAATIVSR